MASDATFSPLPDICCSGSPYEIGLKHGQDARSRIHGTIAFYAELFKISCKLDWSGTQKIAMRYEPYLRKEFPGYLQEMNGVAEGANVSLADIIAVNTRTEITFGMFSDGCTSLSWKGEGFDYLAQNWDWTEAQKGNLIRLTIKQDSAPTIKMVTEAGLIGKIGLNSAGVGVCFNAIRAQGSDFARVPVHLALRVALESTSQVEAVQKLEKYGVASSAHILIADSTSGGIGLECSHLDIKKIPMTNGRVEHANHFLLEHPGIVDTKWVQDSEQRTDRIKELATRLSAAKKDPTVEDIYDIFKDEDGYPGAICRKQVGAGVGAAATLFNVVMDLRKKEARYTIGRPSEVPQQDFVFRF